MEYEVKQIAARKIAGFHMVGPWEQTVKQGFEQLMMWVDGQLGSGWPFTTTIRMKSRRKSCVATPWSLSMTTLLFRRTARGS